MTISSPRHEFDYVEDKSCFRAQCSCFCGMGSCRFCCRSCPPMNESTLTRIVYLVCLMVAVLLMGILLSTEIQNEIMRLFPPDFSVCEWLGAGSACHAGKLMGHLAVYRIGLAITLYHLTLMLCTCGVKSSKDCRAGFHNGLWLFKIMLLIVLGCVAFIIPDYKDYFINVWMYTAMTGAAAFIVIQLLLLVFMIHRFTDKIQEKVDVDGTPIMWYAFLGPGLAIIMFVLSGTGIFLLYHYFASDEGCYKNQWFIFINAGGCFIVSFVAGVRKDPKPVGLRLLHASMISLYVTYLTWVAISSAPRRYQRYNRPSYPRFPISNRGSFRFNAQSFRQDYYCGPNKDEEMWTDQVIPYVSFVITFVSVLYGSIGISEPEKCHALELPGCPNLPTGKGGGGEESHDKEDHGGQIVIRNEKKGLVYSYSLFHAMMALACLLMMMHLTNWHTPTHASLMTFGRSWSSVWIKISSSWVCLIIYFITVLCPSVLPSVLPSATNTMKQATSLPIVTMNGHAIESDSDATSISEEAVPLNIIKRPTIISCHQETTV